MIYTYERLPAPLPCAAFRRVLDAAATTFDPRASLPAPLDQHETNICVGKTYRRAFWIAAGMLGEEPSDRAIYNGARMRKRARTDAPLVDQGCNVFDALGSLTLTGEAANDAKVWGLVPLSVWPSDDAGVNDELPFDVQQAAVPIMPGDVQQIASIGAQRIADIKASVCGTGARLLAPVPFAMPVDSSYEQLSGSAVWTGLRGPVKGYHCQYICGFRPSTRADAQLDEMLVCGSWGDWADQGYAWVAGDFVASAVCEAFVIARGAPRLA